MLSTNKRIDTFRTNLCSDYGNLFKLRLHFDFDTYIVPTGNFISKIKVNKDNEF